MTTLSEPDFNGAIFAWSKYYSLTSSYTRDYSYYVPWIGNYVP